MPIPLLRLRIKSGTKFRGRLRTFLFLLRVQTVLAGAFPCLRQDRPGLGMKFPFPLHVQTVLAGAFPCLLLALTSRGTLPLSPRQQAQCKVLPRASVIWVSSECSSGHPASAQSFRDCLAG